MGSVGILHGCDVSLVCVNYTLELCGAGIGVTKFINVMDGNC